ncbi:MAG: orotidine 5'-phosphate decarboxylase, partial [Actinobacteria bacterium]|nr:orotidine 5'-phosphate decarboxylase [Actinomycetota bacterium]
VSSNDHVRVLTPREAMAAGADHVVVGRPVIDAADPAAAARRVVAEL